MRVLCLDIGDKRIGVAVSDPSGQTALGVTTFQRGAFKKDCAEILNWAKEYEAGKIIVGLPLDLENKEGRQAGKVRFFAEGLQKECQSKSLPITIELYDESFSSREAEEHLLKADWSRQKRRKAMDKVAAMLILQQYLNEHG